MRGSVSFVTRPTLVYRYCHTADSSLPVLSPKISTADRKHARTGPDTQRAQAHNHTQNSKPRTHPRQTSCSHAHTHLLPKSLSQSHPHARAHPPGEPSPERAPPTSPPAPPPAASPAAAPAALAQPRRAGGRYCPRCLFNEHDPPQGSSRFA